MTFFITGTSTGLGAALAQKLLDRGHFVAGVSRRKTEIDSPRYQHFSWDLNDLTRTEEVVKVFLTWAEPKGSGPYVLVNNAATPEPLALVDSPAWPSVANQIQLNLTVPLVLTGAFLRLSKTLPVQKRVVVVTSGLSTFPLAGLAGYSASKAGLDQFVRCLHKENQGQGSAAVKAVAVNPGMMDTQMQLQVEQADPLFFPQADLFAQAKQGGKMRDAQTVAASFADLLENDQRWGDGVVDL